jgi:glycosyltransferase involved in cell wall biosynthesis
LLSFFRFSRYIHLALDLGQYLGYLRLKVLLPSGRGPTPDNDITIISATLGEEEKYAQTLQSWLRCNPKAVNIVTVDRAAYRMKELLKRINDGRIVLHTVAYPDIRNQLATGILNTTTRIFVLVDDDSQWSPQTLSYIESAFTDASVGGVNTMQYVRPRLQELTIWESFGALNLVRRNILHSAVAYFNDGQVLNLSGRTVAYRTDIIKNKTFLDSFLNEFWRGRYLIKTGDDNFLTSWIVCRGWKTVFLNQPNAVIFTTVNADATYLNQVLRWSRDTARNYLRDLGFAFRSNEHRLYARSFLNWICNYMTDFLVLGELSILVLLSVILRARAETKQFDLSRYVKLSL